MTDFGSLIEGIGLAAIGGFLAFAPQPGTPLNKPVPRLRLGGGLRQVFGHSAILLGVALILTWVSANL